MSKRSAFTWNAKKVTIKSTQNWDVVVVLTVACACYNTFPLHTFCQGYIIKGRLSILFAYYFVQLALSCGPFGINLILAPSISQLFVTEECDRRFYWHKQAQRGVGRPSSSTWNWNQIQLLNHASVQRTSFRVPFFSYFKTEPQPNGFAQLKQLFMRTFQ